MVKVKWENGKNWENSGIFIGGKDAGKWEKK
jgi:hypothetical protein